MKACYAVTLALALVLWLLIWQVSVRNSSLAADEMLSTLCISLWCWFMGADNYKYNMGINYESLMFYFLVQGLLLCHFEFFFLSVFHLLAFLNPLWAAACTAADTHTRTHFYSQG